MDTYRYQIAGDGYLDQSQWIEIEAESHRDCALRAAMDFNEFPVHVYVHHANDGRHQNGAPMVCQGFLIDLNR